MDRIEYLKWLIAESPSTTQQLMVWLHRAKRYTPGMKELATLTWVDWYNKRRLLGRLGHTPPAEAEKAYYASIGNNDLAA